MSWRTRRMARLQEVESLLQELACSDEETLEEGGGQVEQATELIQGQEVCLGKLREHTNDLKTKKRMLEAKIASIKSNNNKFDVAKLKRTIEDLEQTLFDSFMPIVMGKEPSGTLDRFRNMSKQYKEALFSVEVEATREDVILACDDRDKTIKELEIANGKIQEFEKRNASANSTIAQLKKGREEMTKELQQARDKMNEKINDICEKDDRKRQKMDETHGNKVQKLEGEIYELKVSGRDSDKRINEYQEKIRGLENDIRDLKKEVSQREFKELGIARFFMNQSGLARDASDWIPFVEAMGKSKEVELLQLLDHEIQRPWTILQTWDVQGVPVADQSGKDLVSLMIQLHGRALAGIWDEETIDLVRLLVLQLNTVKSAPVDVLLYLLYNATTSLQATQSSEGGPHNINAHLVAFALWQGAKILQRRWPDTDAVSQTAYYFEQLVANGWQCLATFVSLLGDDSGVEMKALIRARRGLTDNEIPPPNSPVSSALIDKPVQYCEGQDIGLLSMPGIGWRVWVVDLTHNTIRLVHNARGEHVFPFRYVLRAPVGMGDDIEVPNETQYDFNWVIDNLCRG